MHIYTQIRASDLGDPRYHLTYLQYGLHRHERAGYSVNLSWAEFIDALTEWVPAVPRSSLPRTFLLQDPWASSTSARRLVLLGGSGSDAMRSGKNCWMSSQSSFSLSSFSCLERVLSETSRPPLQRIEHAHQTIGRFDKRDAVDVNSARLLRALQVH